MRNRLWRALAAALVPPALLLGFLAMMARSARADEPINPALSPLRGAVFLCAGPPYWPQPFRSAGGAVSPLPGAGTHLASIKRKADGHGSH